MRGGDRSRVRWIAATVVALAASITTGYGSGSAASPGPGGDVPPAVFTPVLMRIADAPVPVKGSDERHHLVYELELTNFSNAHANLEQLEVLDADSGAPVAVLGADELAERLTIPDAAASPGSLGVAQFGFVSIHIAFDAPTSIPAGLDHRLSGTAGERAFRQTAARVQPAEPTTLVLDPPLRGPRFIAGDGCCDSHRHVRAMLPVNGRLHNAQRFAIDWEQLDEQGRIYVGNPRIPASYVIYEQPVYAVADGWVIAAVDGMQDSPPGAFPEDITLEQADGNHVVLDLGNGRYALYAHLAPHSVLVKRGQQVRRGQMLGQVGSSGNSSEPHLHFHLTDGPSPLAANGLPYLLSGFSATRRGVSTAAFDQAIVDGQPIATEPVPGAPGRAQVMPMDLWVVDFPE